MRTAAACNKSPALCGLGRTARWDGIDKIPVEATIKRWKVKGCEKGQSRRLKKLFADGRVVDAEMEQAAGVEGVTATNVWASLKKLFGKFGNGCPTFHLHLDTE